MTHTNTGRFDELGIGGKLLSVLTKKGFTVPTPIQDQVIPGALAGNDVIGIAQTGTGKTLAFGIPMVQKLMDSNTKGKGMIIVPTRELAEQVDAEMKKIGLPLGLRTAVLIGGSSEKRQIRALKNNPHLIVATPGRLTDFVDRNIVKLANIAMITLDEADRMLDMGFLPSIKQLIKKMPKDRQTMLFSATMPKSIASLAKDFMRTPMRVEIAPQGTTAKNVEQELYVVNRHQKMSLLTNILKQYDEDTVLVFSRTKHGAKRMVRNLRDDGYAVTEIHGNRTQAQRRRALEGFSNRKFRIMVATDVAARGIDVDHLSLVINYDLPDSLEDYVHRIGRTGRAGRSGRAISFATPDQGRDVRGIERIIKKSLKVLNLPDLPKRSSGSKQEKQDNQRKYQGKQKKNFSKSRNRNRRHKNRRRAKAH